MIQYICATVLLLVYARQTRYDKCTTLRIIKTEIILHLYMHYYDVFVGVNKIINDSKGTFMMFVHALIYYILISSEFIEFSQIIIMYFDV